MRIQLHREMMVVKEIPRGEEKFSYSTTSNPTTKMRKKWSAVWKKYIYAL